MYFLKKEDAQELKLTGLEFKVGDRDGVLVEEKDFAVRQKEMNFECDNNPSEFDGILNIDNIRFKKAAAAPVAGMDPEWAKQILDQANVSMRENIKLIGLINKLKKV